LGSSVRAVEQDVCYVRIEDTTKTLPELLPNHMFKLEIAASEWGKALSELHDQRINRRQLFRDLDAVAMDVQMQCALDSEVPR